MKKLLWLAAFHSLAIGMAEARCKPEELSLKWPIRTKENIEWVVNNYVDLDTTAGGMKDYKGNLNSNAKTYDGHGGIDIDTPTFRESDNGVNVFASAAGTVTSVQSDLFDRNYVGAAGCGPWNHVAVTHDNGFVSYYGHLRKGSVRVKVGDVIPQGKALGLVGSSGCSSTAHLHFELQCDGAVVDPMLQNMFTNPPEYSPPLRVMDMIVRKGEFPNVNNDALMKDPQPNITSIQPGSRLAVGLTTSGGRNGDTVDIQILRGDNSLWTTFGPITVTGEWRHNWPRWWINLPNNASGIWLAIARVNGTEVMRKAFTVEPNPLAFTYAMPDVAYQANFVSLGNDSYRTLQIDGSTSPDGARISAIHRRDGLGVHAFHNINYADFATLYRQQTARGAQLLNFDSYVWGGQILWAGYFGPKVHGGWRVEHMLNRTDHLRVFEEAKRAGLVPYVISVAVLNGTHYYSSAYGQSASSGIVASADITEAAYQQVFNLHTGNGMGLAYLDVYDNGQGTPLFSAIWRKEVAPSRQLVRHNLKQGEYNALSDQLRAQGMTATHITSYLKGGNRYYAGIWTR